MIDRVTSYMDILQNLAEEILDTIAEYRAVMQEKSEGDIQKTDTQ